MPKIQMKIKMMDLLGMDIDDLNTKFDEEWSNHPDYDGELGMDIGYTPIEIIEDDVWNDLLVEVNFGTEMD